MKIWLSQENNTVTLSIKLFNLAYFIIPNFKLVDLEIHFMLKNMKLLFNYE